MKIKKEHRNLLIALSLGDGYINKRGYLDIWHSEKQKEYVNYKYSLIKEYCKIEVQERTFSGKYKSYGFRTRTFDFCKLLRRVLYKNGKKTITRKLLNRLAPFHLAIWWMDDGSKGIKYNKEKTKVKACVYRLSLCTTKEECQIVIDWLKETYNISFGITKEKNLFSITCGTREGRKFSDLIREYIIPSMLYKIS